MENLRVVRDRRKHECLRSGWPWRVDEKLRVRLRTRAHIAVRPDLVEALAVGRNTGSPVLGGLTMPPQVGSAGLPGVPPLSHAFIVASSAGVSCGWFTGGIGLDGLLMRVETNS